jgi:hypothetical protein
MLSRGFLILIMNLETVVALIAERAGNLKGVVLAAALQWLLLIAVMKGPLCTEWTGFVIIFGSHVKVP